MAAMHSSTEPESHVESQLRLGDGRRMAYAEVGDLAGQPVIYCHGFPASRLESRLVAAAAQRLGVRIIAPDRPGYGGSDFKAERALTDWAGDVDELADRLKLDRFRVLGVSGGGPYALALTSSLPERVEAVAIVCGLGPVCRPEALDPMHWPARLGFGTANTAPWLNRLFYGGVLGRLLKHRPDTALALLSVGANAADRRVLARPEVRAMVSAALREGLRQGTRGALLDMALYAREWPFDPSGIEAPLSFWHGDADATVPVCHTRLVAASLPWAEVRILAGEGHFSLPIEHADAILNNLLNLTRKHP
jgi:pimeloyl-ACP methyl ester carboxylesterase